MSLYYYALYDDTRVAGNMISAVNNNLSKFESFLTLAITAMREKELISARWEKVQDPTFLEFEPLAYELRVHATSSVEVYIEENYLELNVRNSVPFDASEGIKLGQNWMPLHPNQYEVISITDTRHLLHIKDPSDYTGEVSAETKHSCIVDVSPFMVKDLMQNGNHLEILSQEYDRKKKCYRFNISGSLEEEDDLNLNGLTIDKNDWHILDAEQDQYKNEEGSILPILGFHGNTLYIENIFPKPQKLYQGEKPISFEIKPLDIPEWIENGEEKVYITPEKSILVKAEFLEGGYKYYHPSLRVPLFNITIKETNKSSKWKAYIAIRLIEEDDDNDSFSKSKVDYFFDQDIEELGGVIDDKKVKFTIYSRKEDERIINLKNPVGEKLDYDDIPEILEIRMNTYQLEMQRKAIRRLKNTPLIEHKPLIKLSQKKSMDIWPEFSPEENVAWQVLSDSSREGVQAQRDFVKKALATPDFALLEGPPGSGKTTTILELILQLIKRRKKVLLCGSTHVAIDNVLERLKEKGLMAGVLPLRIGNRDSVSPYIKDFCLSKYEDYRYKDIMLEAANLVCGTTIGILKHPLFQLKDDEPPVPLYDYLIIDESSKTTFQEFLVPALYAKKWILVGDIKQLPPYNDDGQITAAIDDNSKLPGSLKRAALLLFQYLHNRQVRMPVCIVEPNDVIKDVKKELYLKEIKKRIAVVDDTPGAISDSFVTINKEDLLHQTKKLWALNGLDLLFVNEKLYHLVKPYIPSHMVVIEDDWEDSSHSYQVNAFYSEHPHKLHEALKDTMKSERNREKQPIDFFIEQKKFLKKTNWASEYGWRLRRIFELENVERSKNREFHKRQLDLLCPKTANKNSIQDIEQIRDIALPSILQSLQVGVGKKRESIADTTLNSGFNEAEINNRFVTLNYQHRMHPEISRFPRTQFYQDSALLDSTYTKINREWSYERYPSRSVWINVAGKGDSSTNEAEATVLIKEMKSFIAWAAENKNQENESGKWVIACLAFYNGQRRLLARKLGELTGQTSNLANFETRNVEIKNYTVDKFQGQEADITFLSMVRTKKVGFLDNPNRLNVGITRARFQRVIIGKYAFFLNCDKSEQLKLLTIDSVLYKNS